jgi:2-oxoglutarate dehydrogenase E2 component (dihydrolipoamide succinyltransferase)
MRSQFMKNIVNAQRRCFASSVFSKTQLTINQQAVLIGQRPRMFVPLQARFFGVETVAVPGMGDSISEGVIEEFLKQPGEFVEADEIMARIETDKVTVDIPAPKAGIIKEYFAEEGDTVEVGGKFYTLDTDGKAADGAPAAAKAEAPKEEAPAAAPPK